MKIQRPMIICGVVLATMSVVAIGCSKKSNSTPTTRTQNISAPAEVAAVPPTTAPVAPPEVKKQKRHRPAIVTYSDSTYGISFRYPRKYSLKQGDEAATSLADLGPLPLNFVQPGGVTIVSVEMPSGSYPKTDFSTALLNLNVNRSLTPEECSQFALAKSSDSGSSIEPTKVKVGDREFDEIEALGEQGKAQADARYYHIFENGACYEFALALGTADVADIEGISPVNRDAVFGKLEKILATVKIDSVSSPEIVSQAPVSTSQPKQ